MRLLRILAQMAVMLVWKGCFFLSLLSLCCDVRVLCICTNACCACSNYCLALTQSVFLFFSHPNFSAASHSQRKGDAYIRMFSAIGRIFCFEVVEEYVFIVTRRNAKEKY